MPIQVPTKEERIAEIELRQKDYDQMSENPAIVTAYANHAKVDIPWLLGEVKKLDDEVAELKGRK